MKIIKSLGFLSISLFGYISIMPNIMLCDSGSEESICSAYTGLTASGLFITCGVCGLIQSFDNKLSLKIPPKLAFAIGSSGVLLQIIAFTFIPHKLYNFKKKYF